MYTSKLKRAAANLLKRCSIVTTPFRRPTQRLRKMLENETFLSELTNLFAASRAKGGSLYITLKRYDGRTKPIPRKQKGNAAKNEASTTTTAASSSSSSEFNKCLIRAHLGNKKISTVINAKDVNKFQLAYSNLLKGNFYGLKKRKREKKVGIDK